MRSSNNALMHIEGGCANDDSYAYTPSGVRTKIALKPEGIVVPLFNPLAYEALADLAAADEAREEEEPTAEWTPTRRNIEVWDESQLQDLLDLEREQEQTSARLAQPQDRAEPETERAQPAVDDAQPEIELGQTMLDTAGWNDAELDALAEGWMWSEERQLAPHVAASKRQQKQRAVMAPCPADWTTATWVVVAASVMAGELAALFVSLV